MWRYIQKFPDWVDNEIYNNNNKQWLRNNTMGYGGRPTGLTLKIAIQLHLVAEIRTICSSRSRRPVRKLLDVPSYIPHQKVFQIKFVDEPVNRFWEILLN
jgi:hypothetical protein